MFRYLSAYTEDNAGDEFEWSFSYIVWNKTKLISV